MKYDRLTFALATGLILLIVILGALLGLDAAGRPWDADHPIRWFFRDFGAIIGATVAAIAAIFTIQTMREQFRLALQAERERTDRAIEADHKRTAAEQAANLRSQIDVVRSTWNSFRINVTGVLTAYRFAQDEFQSSGVEPDNENQVKALSIAYKGLDPIPLLPQLNMGHMPPGIRSSTIHAQTIFNHAIQDLNSVQRTAVALSTIQEGLLRQWERCEIALLGSILFMESVARRTVDDEPFDGTLEDAETTEIVIRLGLGRTMPAVLRKNGMNPSTDFPAMLLQIPETDF